MDHDPDAPRAGRARGRKRILSVALLVLVCAVVAYGLITLVRLRTSASKAAAVFDKECGTVMLRRDPVAGGRSDRRLVIAHRESDSPLAKLVDGMYTFPGESDDDVVWHTTPMDREMLSPPLRLGEQVTFEYGEDGVATAIRRTASC